MEGSIRIHDDSLNAVDAHDKQRVVRPKRLPAMMTPWKANSQYKKEDKGVELATTRVD